MGYGRSMNELVKVLGSKSTIYGYFPSKEVLFAAVLELCHRASVDAERAVVGVDGRVALRRP